MGRVCSLRHGDAIEPRLRRLHLGGKDQQGRLLILAAGEMHANRQAIRRPEMGPLRTPHDTRE
jgi:hypothetical protein